MTELYIVVNLHHITLYFNRSSSIIFSTPSYNYWDLLNLLASSSTNHNYVVKEYVLLHFIIIILWLFPVSMIIALH